MSPVEVCPDCGRELSEHDRHIRFVLPDPVLASGIEPGDERVWTFGADPLGSTMMQVEGVGAFVRALLPVHLTGGFSITFGVWVAITIDDMHFAIQEWNAPTYPNLVLGGRLANAIPPWGLLGSPVSLAVLDPDHTPYCVNSADPSLAGVLVDEWPHELVLTALPRA